MTQRIAKQSKETMAGIVEERYGEEAGKVVKDGMEINENLIMIQNQRKGIVGKVAGATAKEFARDKLDGVK